MRTEVYNCDKCGRAFEYFEGFYLDISRLAINAKPIKAHLCPDCVTEITKDLKNIK